MDVMLLIFIAVIGDDSGINLADIRDQLPPFLVPVVCHDHFTSGDEHIAALSFCDFRKMQLKRGVGREPLTPLGFTGNVFIEEMDMSAPHTVFTVDRRLDGGPKPPRLSYFNICGG